MTIPAGVLPDEGLSFDWASRNPIRIVSIVAGAGFQVVSNGDVFLYGWAFEETTGTAPARVVLIDGQDVNGQSVMPIDLKAGESTRDWLGFPGLTFVRAVGVNVSLGSVAGTVWEMDR